MSAIKRLFWISLVVKMVLAALLPLTNDEAYYWVWARHLQLSYYDHPPFVAWLYWLGEWIRQFGGSVRWPGVLLGHAGLAIWLKLLKPYLSDDQRRIWLWLTLLSPLAGGSILIVTPDLPLMFFYALAVALFLKWRENPSRMNSLGLGLAVGLGFASKYMMVLFALSVLPLVLVRAPRVFLRSLPLLLLGVIIGTTPVWLWNILNDFASFKFQVSHGLGRKVWKPSWTIHYVGAQIGLIFPIVLYWALRSRRKLPIVFHWLAWTPVLFFFFTTYRGYAEANWPVAAYPAIFALAAAWYPRNARGLYGTVALWGVLIAALAVVVITRPDWSKPLKFREFHQFDAIVEAGRPLTPLYARSYQMAAKLYYELERPVYKLRGMNRRDFFDYLPDSQPKSGIYYLALERGEPLPPVYVSRGDRIVETIEVDERFVIVKVESP